jgi:SagB-type dehydrogenase family enzyme
MLFFCGGLAAQDLKPLPLPKPQTTGGKPLMEALSERKTTREFGAEKLSPQKLSNLLWAAYGINRPDGRRTAPSAMNRQEIDVYVVTVEGIYRYDAKGNVLQPVASGDLRATAGGQDFVRTAPLNLVYVADLKRMGGGPETESRFWAAADTGFIAQNVYLYCASEGLATVVRGTVDHAEFSKAAKLRPDQRVTLAQTVGYPK